MSGLEGLGAAASVIGVVGVLKTCIDLLDIISSVRRAEDALEDLTLHLQIQRIKFYSWVQVSGFAEIIAQQEDKVASDIPESMTLLPHELRLPLILSHIKSSVKNMNARLASARSILERYSAKAISNQDSWMNKLRRGLHPGSELMVLHESSAQSGVSKLSFMNRLRWVAGDEKELTKLVDGLEKYNSDLKELLPYYKIAQYERRVLLALVTSRPLVAGIAASRPESPTLQSIEEDEQFRQHQGVAQLMERGYEMNFADMSTQSSRRSVDNRLSPNLQDQCSLEQASSSPPDSNPRRSWGHYDLYLSMSEFEFSWDGATDAPARIFASRGSDPCIIEWRYYSTRTSIETLSFLDARVHMLAMQLQQSATLTGFSILNCLGHFRDEKNHRYGLAFSYPKGNNVKTPISLHDRLIMDQKRRIRRDLDERFHVARTLITTIYGLFSVHWLHKNLTSSNILLFEDSTDSHSINTPYICGFDFARRDAELETSETFPSLLQGTYSAAEQGLYWHPDRKFMQTSQGAFGVPRGGGTSTKPPSYSKLYDAYSLGILLLEIGLWCPIQRIWKDCKSDDLGVFAVELKNRYVPELRGRMGKVYADIVRRCLDGDFVDKNATHMMEDTNDNENSQTESSSSLFLEGFERLVVSMIEKPIVF